MTFQHRNTIASLLSTLFIFSIYAWQVSGSYAAGAFENGGGMQLVGKYALLMMAAGIVTQIVGRIVASIVWAILTRTPKPSFVVDERDREFELRAVRVGYHVTGVGFVLAMIALTMGWSVFAAFQIIIGSCGVGTVIEGLVLIRYYRRGA